MSESFSIGLDYGTNSVRAVVVRCSDGLALSEAVVDYPSGRQGILIDPGDHNLARQNPADYLYGLEKAVTGALAKAAGQDGFDAAVVVGIGVDSTGSSPMRSMPRTGLWR
jgi:L-ribulokinase